VQFDPEAIRSRATKLGERLGDEAYFARACARSGLFVRQTPGSYAEVGRVLLRYGLLGGSVAASAILHADHPVVIDELGTLTYGELGARVDSLAAAWRERGLVAGDGVAIIARNHRGFLEAFFAAAKSGARVILLNTSFSGPQIRDVAGREGTDLLVYDDEYGPELGDYVPRLGRWRAWIDPGSSDGGETLADLIATTPPSSPPRPAQQPKVVILTSGTTGAPKGAGRDVRLSLAPIGSLLGKVPFRTREVTQLGAPTFHALGFAHMILGVVLGSTLVLHRHFEPERVLESLEQNRATAMIAVPVMIQRMLDLDDLAWAGRDLSHFRILFVSGSQLGVELARRATERLGPVIYNLYGSTEVAYATIATPEDLAAAPGCVGHPVRGAVVRILGDDGTELPPGQTGRVFVGNANQFEGYTGGGTKEQIDGLMASGDVGHMDFDGRLFIDGRDDEMIISGGENVFPAEVEELLVHHGAVAEAAAIGVVDDQFGQRLRAFVVLRDGAETTEDELKAYVRENLARYKVPREVVFLDELPRNPTGKVLKRELQHR
jgi:fatty-acyl-CoA synthase